MSAYIPEHYYGHIPGTYGDMGLVPWPDHLKPREQQHGIELTKKGEAYVATALAEADGILFLTLDSRDRVSISMTIERLINMLDTIDGDCDLEETGDDEPWIGWPEAYGMSQLDKCQAIDDDREHDDCNDEKGGDDEPSLGWPEQINQNLSMDYTERNDPYGEGEPELGWTHHGLGLVGGEYADDGDREGYDEREGDDERELDSAEDGLADRDAMMSEKLDLAQELAFRGEGQLIARTLLRKIGQRHGTR